MSRPSGLESLHKTADALLRASRKAKRTREATTDVATDVASDVQQTALDHLASLGRPSGILFGCIQEAIPYVNSYRVAPEGGGPVVQCCYLRDLPATPVSVADHTNLQIGANVFYIKHPTATYGLIIGVEPPYIQDARKARSDVIAQGSRCGIDVEQYFKELWQLGAAGSNAGIIDWSARQPGDSIPIGEFCKTAMTGIQLFMDNYMAHMRVDEMCGIWMCYWDSFLRIAGQNFQRWTAGSAFESMDDEGEHFWHHGIAAYPWENWGYLIAPTGTTIQLTENDASTIQKTNQEYGPLEPEYDDAQAFHRIQTWNGYLGQGGKRLVCQPPTDASGLQRYDIDLDHLGLVEENRSLSGHYAIRTARGLTIGRRPLIAVPKRKKVLEDTDGDSADNYRTSGHYGGGLPHKVTIEPTLKAPAGQEQLSRVAGIHDWHANVFNWECAHPFDYHAEDYYYPDESELASSGPIDSNQYIPEWSELSNASQWYLSEPPKSASKVKVDHRDGYEDYLYKVSQYLTFTEDGAVVLGDGSGSEIRMVGGDIQLQCAGDVFCEPGRNFMAWAGRDAIVRAYQSLDLTATMNDVRVKAEHNIQMVAANDGGPYGLLFECRASQTSYDFASSGQDAQSCGIIFHAPCAELIGLADNIYLRTGVPSAKASGVSGGAPPEHGDIVIDAANGVRNVSIWAHTVADYVKCAVVHAFDPSGTGAAAATVFMEEGANIAGNVYIDGSLANAGSHVLSGQVGPNQDVSAGTAHQVALRAWAGSRFDADITSMWYNAGRPGNTDMLRGLWASLRTTDDYNSNGFVLYETRWAQMGRAAGNIPAQWAERKVTDGNGDTFPFPGKEQFQDKQVYYVQDNELYDTTAGQSKARGAQFEAPSYGKPKKRQLNCNYPIIGP